MVLGCPPTAAELEGPPEVILACTWQGHPEVLPSLVRAKSCFPEVALPGKAFPVGPLSEVSSLPRCDLTSGMVDRGYHVMAERSDGVPSHGAHY